MVPTSTQAQVIIGQAVTLFQTMPDDPGPWTVKGKPGGQITLADGVYIATLPSGWTVDHALADKVTDEWQAQGNDRDRGWSNASSAVINLGAGQYGFFVRALYTPPAGVAAQFKFEMR